MKPVHDTLLPAAGAPDLLFLLLHGGGATPEQMRPLAAALRGAYPQAAVLLLEAPEALPSEAVRGFRWFDESDAVAGVAAALPGFIAGVQALAQQFALDWPRVALVGFSQGGLMALEAVQVQQQLAGRVLAFAAAPLARGR